MVFASMPARSLCPAERSMVGICVIAKVIPMAKRTWLFSALLLLAATGASAQQPFPTNQQPFAIGGADKEPNRAGPLANITPTQDMWFYEQESRRHDSPENAVRRKAEFQTYQRQMRIASREWFGMSNSRPNVNPTPVTGTYAPTWVGNSREPNYWRGVQPGPVILNVRRVGAGPAYGLW